ncbi:MAG TPA: UDP-N-acetylmuramate:L-alanyl-gamma-D-glutamyl-meso-diaminopimelate ligase [Rhodothermales bacterium]|nr:UDP-N-acetylmuramate:L-alanyl-gamma-D-glutamyl-meso-diaminopimelate ligase [Rhodothermales bacterium]
MKSLRDLPDAELRIFERALVPPKEDIRTIYLIGICGTGMGSLAGLLQQAGYEVSGSDEAAYPPMSTRLGEMGVHLYEGYDPAHLEPAPDLVVVGNSCTPQHPEAAYAREQGLPQLSMPEALAHFFMRDRRTLVVAGTHGKTTTTGMLVHVMRHAGLDPGFLVGGVMVNGNVSYDVGSDKYFVVEGDEYDSAYFDKRPKFMHYAPTSAIITSMEFDHADIYDDWDDYREAFRAFAGTVSPDGILALYGDDPEVRALKDWTRTNARYYGIEGDDDQLSAADVTRVSGGQEFVLVADGERRCKIFLPMSGRHNLRNALGVCAIALSEGVAPVTIAEGFATFEGLKRRQEIRGEAGGVLVIDDFAHHPTAVKETIRAVADRWPDRRLVAVFEPRSNSSRRKVFEAAYADSFEGASLVFLSAPPLRHNDRADDLLDPNNVVQKVRAHSHEAWSFQNADELLPRLLEHAREGDVVLIMSNGSFGGIHDKLLHALRERQPVSERG